MTKTTKHTKPSSQSSLPSNSHCETSLRDDVARNEANSTWQTEAISSKQRKSLIPKLRFEEFEGEWELLKLKDLTEIITKGTTPKKFVDNGVNYVKIEGLEGVNINKEKCLFIDKEIHEGELKRSILKKNDLLFAIAGATIGKIGIVTDDILPANTNQALAIIRLNNKEFLEFTLQILQSRVMKKYIYQSISVGAQPNLNLEQIGDFKFSQPKLPEQQKIANFLTAVDTKLQQLSTKKEKLEQYKKGVMQQLFSQQLRFKPDVIANAVKQSHEANSKQSATNENQTQFPDWEEKRLGEVCESIKSGKSSSNEEGNYPLYGSTGLIGYCEDYSHDGVFILVARVGANAGTINVVNDKFGVSDNTLVVICNDATDIKFTYFFLDFYNLNRLVFGSGQPLITGGQLKSLKLKLPCLKEQQKIATYLSAIDKKIEAVQTQISNTQAFKKGLLQQMFV